MATANSKLLNRLYVNATLLKSGQEVLVVSEMVHYLRTVLRAKQGDQVRLFNGKDGEWLAEIHVQGKRDTRLVLKEQLRDQQPTPLLTLAFAPIRRQRLEIMVEKATELGVTHFWPLLTERTQQGPQMALKIERLQAIVQEAAEQCERLDLPTFMPLQPLPLWLEALAADASVLAALERDKALPDLSSVAQRIAPTQPILLIGPEGGFSDSERQMLLQHHQVFCGNLGPLILRAETAAIAGLTLMQSGLGRWEG